MKFDNRRILCLLKSFLDSIGFQANTYVYGILVKWIQIKQANKLLTAKPIYN